MGRERFGSLLESRGSSSCFVCWRFRKQRAKPWRKFKDSLKEMLPKIANLLWSKMFTNLWKPHWHLCCYVFGYGSFEKSPKCNGSIYDIIRDCDIHVIIIYEIYKYSPK